ncbi:MFS transporter [Microbacteriaceae bacterium VKM Ac-2855]|nr:MFS transporter [Microbacteriaceae bacterium VKM Ac-2855]
MTSSTVPTLPQQTLVPWRNAIFAIFVLSGISVASWVSRTPTVRDELDLTTAGVGLLILSMSAGSIVGLTLSPTVMGYLGARRGMAVSLVICAAGLAVLGIGADAFGSVPLAFIGMVFLGLGNGACDVMMNIEGAANEKEIGKTLMPLFHAFFSFGTVAGAGLGAGASAIGLPVAVHLPIIAVIVAVGVVIAVRYVPVRDELDAHAAQAIVGAPLRTRDRLASRLTVWRDPRLILIGVIMLGMAFAEGSANDWMTLAMVDGHDVDPTTAAIVFGIFVVSMTVGRVAGGPVLDRFGRVPVLQASAGLAVVGILLFILSPIDALVVVGAVLWGLGSSLGFPVGMSAAADGPNPTARVSSVATIGYVAFLVGPPVLGFLGDAFGILNALFVVLVLVVLAGAASPAARTRAPQDAR